MPKAHYELEYGFNINKNTNYILPDILFEKSHYPAVQLKPIQSIWIETESIIEINLPTIEVITGDKLTAFAPNTTGVLYGKGKELEILKPLFDLGSLFDQIQNLERVSLSFAAFAKQEMVYRQLNITAGDILKDAIDTCRIICFRERNRQEPDKSYFTELLNGIRSLRNFLISGGFTIDEAMIAAAKVACLCAKTANGQFCCFGKI